MMIPNHLCPHPTTPHRYNSTAEDFNTKEEYDEFLEEREDIGMA